MKLCEFDLDRAQAQRGLSPYTLDTTARFHRTLQQAFGPYTSRAIEEPAEPHSHIWADRALYLILAGVVLAYFMGAFT